MGTSCNVAVPFRSGVVSQRRSVAAGTSASPCSSSGRSAGRPTSSTRSRARHVVVFVLGEKRPKLEVSCHALSPPPSGGDQGDLTDLREGLATVGRRNLTKSAATRLTDRAERKERNRQILLDHLADFVHENQKWLGGNFPTREYLSSAGRIDLAEAIRKLGGPAKVATMFGLKWGAPSAPKGPGLDAGSRAGGPGVGSVDSASINVLDRASVERAIEENVDLGHSFMVEHTNSKTPMKESEWTLWKPPISAGTTAETVTEILREAENCSKHHPICYVRITAFDKGDFSRKITFLLHEPTLG